MSDIVERLRSRASPLTRARELSPTAALCREAAAEIERLRNVVQSMKEPMNCECGFIVEVCATNPCMRKKVHLAGLTPGSKWPEAAPLGKRIEDDATSHEAKPFMMLSCREAGRCLHNLPGCICEIDPASADTEPSSAGSVDAVRRIAQSHADGWNDQAAKNRDRRSHYEAISDQFQAIADALGQVGSGPRGARDREDLARVLFDHWKEKNPMYDYVEWGPWYRNHWVTFADAALTVSRPHQQSPTPSAPGVSTPWPDSGNSKLPLQYEDGPDYCTVKDAQGRDFALTMQPELMKAMERALQEDITLLSRRPEPPQTAAISIAMDALVSVGNQDAFLDLPRYTRDLVNRAIEKLAGVAEQSGAGAPETSVRCGAPAATTPPQAPSNPEGGK